jgi:hypothetical protein
MPEQDRESAIATTALQLRRCKEHLAVHCRPANAMSNGAIVLGKTGSEGQNSILHQHALGANRRESLQQRAAQQLLGRDRGPIMALPHRGAPAPRRRVLLGLSRQLPRRSVVLFKTSVDDAPDHTDLMLRRMLEKHFAAKFMTPDQQPTYNAAPSSLLPVILGRNPLEADAQVRISTPKYGHVYALSECSPIGTSIALRLGNSRICSAHQPKLAWNVRTRR